MATSGVAIRTTLSPVSGEQVSVMQPLSWLGRAERPVVLYNHGRGGGNEDFFDGVRERLLRTIALAGYPVVGSDEGGFATWGNDTAIARADDDIRYAESAAVGASAPDVLLLGVSMGNLAMTNWARTHLSRVRGLVHLIPALDLAYHHDHDTLGVAAAEIDAAYGGHAGYLAALPTHSPIEYAATMARTPAAIFYATNDTIAPPASILPYASAVGAALHPAVSRNPTGHDIDAFDPADIVAFLDAHAGAAPAAAHSGRRATMLSRT